MKYILLGCIFLMCNCAGIQRNKIEYIIYGTYAGECIEHCATMYKLENNTLFVDTIDSYFKKKSNGLQFSNDTLGGVALEQAQLVKKQIPGLLLRSGSKVFGSPDNHDQGGVYVELKSGTVIKKFQLDTDVQQIPAELREFAMLVMKTTGMAN
ncbi:MAG: hypothetical protein IT244_07105 [Bacteroidia bacterium]|nr:hypothetical protein [Bacteroidia bacterium]